MTIATEYFWMVGDTRYGWDGAGKVFKSSDGRVVHKFEMEKPWYRPRMNAAEYDLAEAEYYRDASISRGVDPSYWEDRMAQAAKRIAMFDQIVEDMRFDIRLALDQIEMVNESLRAAKDYENSDRLRAAIELLTRRNKSIA